MELSKTKDYVPIDCGFVDVIEHYATLRKEVLIVYLLDGTQVQLTAVIKTWENTGKAEYMILKNGLRIRLDYIVSIGEHSSPGHCEVPKL